jgi:serine/threonine protein phosphatase PrpC
LTILYWEKQFYVANTGDSRAIMKTSDGMVVMSLDQKPDDEIEKQRLILVFLFVLSV